MLDSIKLANYKSYDNSEINIKPISLFCGKNSSGKTAIIKSILLMKQSFEASGNNYLLINGAYTSNGLYENTHRLHSDNSEMGISLSFVIDKENSSFKDICKSMGMWRRLGGYRSFNIQADFLFKENPTMPQVGEIKSLAVDLVINYDTGAKQFPGESITSRIQMESCEDDQHYSIELTQFPTPLFAGTRAEYPYDYQNYSWKDCTCYFRGMQLVSLYKDFLSKKATSVLPVLYTIFRALTSELDKIKYIGPLRETPLRQYFQQDVYSNIGVKGENTAQYLGQFGKSKIKVPLPHNLIPQNVILNDAVSQWATFLGVGKVSVIATDIPGSKITQIMIGEQNIVDVGFGVSQALPIVVEGLTMPAGNTLILEQPEIHLHPKMQMDLTDFLIMLAKQGKHLIIETHSDHIINRIVRRALEDAELRKSIGIYYIDKDEDQLSKLTEIYIDEDIGIDEAPQGFFDQYASETKKILQVGYSNMHIRRGNKQ